MKKRGVKNLLLVLLVLFLVSIIALFFALKNPKVQTKIAKHYTEKLSKKLGTTVSIDSVNFEFFHYLNIKGIYVEDLEGDTLLYAGQVKTSLLKFAPFQNKYDLSNSEMDNVKIRLHRPADSDTFNLTDLLGTSPTDTVVNGKKKKALAFKMKNVTLRNFDFQSKDDLKESQSDVRLPRLDLDFKTFDITGKKLSANLLELDNPFISIVKKPSEDDDEKEPSVFGLPDDWQLKLGKLTINDGTFINQTNPKPAARLTDFAFSDFKMDDFNLDVRKVIGQDDRLDFNIKNLSFKDRTGFEVTTMESKAWFLPTEFGFENLNIITPKSSLQGDLRFGMKSMDDFAEFNDRIKLTADLKSSSLDPVDLDYFFKKSPTQEPITLTGSLKGRVNNLRGKDLYLKFKHGSFIRADIDTRGLPDLENTFFDASITKLYTTSNGLRLITRNNNLSDKITKFQTFDYTGKFTGFLSDLVSYGTLKTDIGSFKTDLNYSKKKNRNPVYSGLITTTKNFRLGYWLDQPDIGDINFSGALKGTGFDIKTLNADIDATINSIQYKSETYTNVSLDGNLNNSVFQGALATTDTDFTANIDGKLDFSGPVSDFNIQAAIENADLNALGLLDSEFKVRGDLKANLIGNSVDEIRGSMIANQVLITSNGQDYSFDTLKMVLSSTDEGLRSLAVSSDKVSAKFTGDYNYTELIPTAKKTINTYYDLERGWDTIQNTITTPTPIGFDFEIKENGELTRLFLPDIDFTSSVQATGTLNPSTNEISMVANADEIRIKQYSFKDWKLDAIGNGETLVVNSSQIDIFNKNSKWLDSSDLTIELSNNSILAEVKSYNEEFLNADIKARFTKDGDIFNASILESDLEINGEKWVISPNNSITLGKEYWEAENFLIQNGDQKISIFNPREELNTKLIADIENIKLEDLNRFINFTGKPLGGTTTGSINLVELEGKLNVDVSLIIDDLMYNNDVASITSIDGLFDVESQKGQIEGIIQDQDYQIGFLGNVDIKSTDRVLDLDLELYKASLHPFENLWEESISDVAGAVTGNLKIYGGPNKFNIAGGDLELIEDLELTLDFTKARYTASSGQVIRVEEDAFIINELILKDKDANTARVTGAITHKDLQDFRLNVSAQTSNFLFLNTTARDNPIFYGKAYAAGSISFTGPVNDALMAVNATTQPNTKITIVAGGTEQANQYSFIRFKEPEPDPDEVVQEDDERLPSKLTMQFDLDVRPNAEVELLFDDQGYNVVRGNGLGDLRINYDTDDLFEIFGRYTISQGEYILSTFLERKFELLSGGFVQWSGDPYEARMNILAEFNLNADLRPLLVTNSLISGGASASTEAPTTIAINIRGPLSEPEFDYTISVSAGGIGSAGLDNVLSQINGDPTLRDQQVTSLLILEQFTGLNANPFGDSGAINDFAVNTLSELVARQFSSLLSDVNALKNTDIGIDYENFRRNTSAAQNPGLDQQIEIAITQKFLDERASLEFGGDINFGDQFNSNNQNNQTVAVGDIVFRYYLRDDNKYQFIVFSRRDYDILNNQDQRRTGFGFVFQKEFNSFKDLFKGKTKEEKIQLQKLKEELEEKARQDKLRKKRERQKRKNKALFTEPDSIPEEQQEDN